MRALITASFDDAAKARLARHMDVVHEDWKARGSIYFDGAQLARRIREVGADVLIVEADLVHAEVLDAVADLTLAFLLMLARHLGPMRDTFREGAARITDAGGFLAMYNRFTGVELGGRTVGLVALGAVGREVAARLGAFKARVLAYDPYVTDAPPG